MIAPNILINCYVVVFRKGSNHLLWSEQSGLLYGHVRVQRAITQETDRSILGHLALEQTGQTGQTGPGTDSLIRPKNT